MLDLEGVEIGSCLRSEADIERWVQRERESNQSEKMGREIERERESVKGGGEK